MLKSNFYLKTTKDKQVLSSIFMRVHLNGQAFQYGTRKSIIVDLWDSNTQRPTTTKSAISRYKSKYPNIDLDLQNIKIHLENIERIFSKIYTEHSIGSNMIDTKVFRTRLDKELGYNKTKSKKDTKLSFESYLDLFIKEITIGDRLIQSGTANGRRYKEGTIKAYENLNFRLKAFKKHINKSTFNYKDFNIDWYNAYTQYAVSKDYHPNSIGNTIKNLKAILNRAKDENHHREEGYKVRAFKKITTKSNKIYLTNDELELIYKLDLSQVEHLDRIRDIFLCGCYTGLRYSDYSRISKEHIKEHDTYKVIDIITLKTNERVIIPMKPELVAILSKYSNSLPKSHEQKINQNIKTIAAKAGINMAIEQQLITKGMTTIKQVSKHKLITTHTARRTAATLMYLADIPTIDIMKITGHKTEKQLLDYIKVSKVETAKRLSINPYFTGNKLVKA